MNPTILYVFRKSESTTISSTIPVIGFRRTFLLKSSAPFRCFSSANLSRRFMRTGDIFWFEFVDRYSVQCLLYATTRGIEIGARTSQRLQKQTFQYHCADTVLGGSPRECAMDFSLEEKAELRRHAHRMKWIRGRAGGLEQSSKAGSRISPAFASFITFDAQLGETPVAVVQRDLGT